MESGMLGSLRLEEEPFIRSTFDELQDINIYVDRANDHYDDGLLLHSSHVESHEDYGRTLNDWHRHVGSFPTMDPEDLVNERLLKFSADIFEYDPPKETIRDVSDVKTNINYGTLINSDNRLIDNDNSIGKNIECNSIFNSLLDSFKSESEPGGSSDNKMISDNSKVLIGSANMNQKSPFASDIHKKYSMNSVKNKRKKQMSLSLPQSPEHDSFGIDGFDLQSSFCLEDISAIDFNEFVDEDINISPEKAFNKSFDINDVLNDPKDMLKKELDSASNLFNPQDMEGDAFDLPSFIMGKDVEDSSKFLIDCFNTTEAPVAPAENSAVYASENNKPSFVVNKDNLTIKVDIVSNIDNIDDSAIKNDTIEQIGVSSPAGSCSSNGHKEDTDDFIDVENFSDGESIPVLAANSVDSLLEQFESSEFSRPSKDSNKPPRSKKLNSVQNNDVYPNVSKIEQAKPMAESKSVPVKVNVKVEQECIFLDHDYCSSGSDHLSRLERLDRSERRIFGKNGSSSKIDNIQKLRDSGEYIDLSPYYKNSQSPHKFGLGKGKNMSMLLSLSERNLCKNEGNSLLKPIVKSEGNSLLKPIVKGKKNSNIYVLPKKVKQNVNNVGENVFVVDNSYPRVNKQENVNISKEMSNSDVNKLNIVHSTKTICVRNGSGIKPGDKVHKGEVKNVQNIIVLENGSERLIDINKDSKNILSINRSVPNKNSLLISNYKKTEEKVIQRKPASKISTARHKVSLLKPIVKENIKMVSVLKSNYSDENDFKKKLGAKLQDTTRTSLLKTTNKSDNINAIKEKHIENMKTIDSVLNSQNNTNMQLNKMLQKKKLNLEEYKRRREGGSNSCDSSRTCSPVSVLNIEIDSNSSTTLTGKFPLSQKSLLKENSALNRNENGVENNKKIDSKCLFDPIAEATKKALKMKKLSARKNNEEEFIKSKISDVQNLIILPLATENGKLLPMIKKKVDEEKQKPVEPVASVPVVHRIPEEFDEIITVCTGTNTEDTILDDQKIVTCHTTRNVSNLNTIQGIQHGENITVMYLSKDRPKPEKSSVSTQTSPEDVCVNVAIIPQHEIKVEAPDTPQQCTEESKVRRERRDSSMSISGESSSDKTYMELINRWKTDGKKSEKSSRSHSPMSAVSDKSKKRSSKYSRRKRQDSESSNSSRYSTEYRRRSRSYSRNKRRRRGSRDRSHYSRSYREKDSLDNGSIRSLPTSKRKRNPSMSSNDWKGKSTKTNQLNGKVIKDYDSSWDNRSENNESGIDGMYQGDRRPGSKRYRRSRSLSGSGKSLDRDASGSDSDSSDCSRNSFSSYSCGRSHRSSRSRSRGRSRSRSRKHSEYVRRGSSTNSKKSDLHEERKILYVGQLEPDITVSELKMKFIKYGSVDEVKICRKERSRFGFVTFAQAQQSYKALECAMTDPDIKHYEVYFGGRRSFCMQNYADLDEIEALQEESGYYPNLVIRSLGPSQSFEKLLLETKAALSAKQAREKKHVKV